MESNNADVEQNPPDKNYESKANVEEAKNFFKTKLLSIIKKIIAEPIRGCHEIFATPDKNKQSNAISLLGIGFIFIMLITYLTAVLSMPKGYGSRVEFGICLKISLLFSIILLLIAVFSLVVKSIGGAKISFGDELLTGGICVIPLCLFFLILFIMSLFSSGSSIGFMGRGGFGDFITGGSLIMLAAIIYLFLYLVTIIQQSLKASKVNDALSWYLSPLILVLSFYIGSKIGVAILS